jgi:hypothetical protein
MDLAFNLLLIFLIEVPIIGFFFKRKKRSSAYVFAFLINAITWPIINVIRLNTDWNLIYVQCGITIVEIVAYIFFIQCSWKKALLMAIIANTLSFVATKYIKLPENLLKKPYEITML